MNGTEKKTPVQTVLKVAEELETYATIINAIAGTMNAFYTVMDAGSAPDMQTLQDVFYNTHRQLDELGYNTNVQAVYLLQAHGELKES